MPLYTRPTCVSSRPSQYGLLLESANVYCVADAGDAAAPGINTAARASLLRSVWLRIDRFWFSILHLCEVLPLFAGQEVAGCGAITIDAAPSVLTCPAVFGTLKLPNFCEIFRIASFRWGPASVNASPLAPAEC